MSSSCEIEKISIAHLQRIGYCCPKGELKKGSGRAYSM